MRYQTSKGDLAAICTLLIIWAAIAWLSSRLGPYLQSTSANCEDEVIRRANMTNDVEAIWARRKCGALYGGGPYTVLKLKAHKFLDIFRITTDIVEVEDNHGNFMPRATLQNNRLFVSGIPDHAEYKVASQALGFEVVVVKGRH